MSAGKKSLDSPTHNKINCSHFEARRLNWAFWSIWVLAQMLRCKDFDVQDGWLRRFLSRAETSHPGRMSSAASKFECAPSLLSLLFKTRNCQIYTRGLKTGTGSDAFCSQWCCNGLLGDIFLSSIQSKSRKAPRILWESSWDSIIKLPWAMNQFHVEQTRLVTMSNLSHYEAALAAVTALPIDGFF